MSVQWDGIHHSYRPRPGWIDRISSSVSLHTIEDDVDPVTFEVLRNRMWTINIGHGETLKRVSGSPVYQSGDFNVAILTETGETVIDGPYAQFLSQGAPNGVAYILEHLSHDPGIADGDIFLTNDPWIGAVHQMDVLLAMPVFVDGKVFAWVADAGHQYDLGGVAPGGWPVNAVDVFDDPVVIPPIRLVESGHMRADLERMYLRHSRFPGFVALDLRSQIAGCRFAAEQIKAAVADFGAATVKGAMRKLLSMANSSFRQKLASIPDGRWQEVLYFDEKLPGDRGHQRVCLSMDKIGDRLRISNEGTDPQQEGSNGMTYLALTGCILGALTTVFMQDQLYPVGAVARQVDFDVEPGLMTSVDHPAAVSGGVLSASAMCNASITLCSRLAAAAESVAADAIEADAEFAMVVISGADDTGRAFGTALIEQPFSLGATSWKDGMDYGGQLITPLQRYLNAEEQEGFYPVLILWRRRVPDSMSAGQWRGGAGISFGVTEYRSAALNIMTSVGAQGASGHASRGGHGALPSPGHDWRVLRGTNVVERFKARCIPASQDDLAAEEVLLLRAKTTQVTLAAGDVLVGRYGGSGGFGDPLLRDPERVAADVRYGWVSSEAALRMYGVVMAEAGAVDVERTRAAREEIRRERLAWTPVRSGVATPDPEPIVDATGEPPVTISPCLEAADDGAERVVRCRRCEHRLAGYAGNYLEGLLVADFPVTAIPLARDSSFYLDPPMVLRCYCCSSCGVQMSARVIEATEPHNPDIRLFASSTSTT
jgi:N-methylhydantoinase B